MVHSVSSIITLISSLSMLADPAASLHQTTDAASPVDVLHECSAAVATPAQCFWLLQSSVGECLSLDSL